MKERLQKILSAHGIASRRKAEDLIAQGRVTCNGAVASLGDSADPEVDAICVDGISLRQADAPVYLMLNKPRGYVTTLRDPQGRPNTAQLVSGCGVRVYPVGRLDLDSEGLLLLTNDGAWANNLMHPRHQVEKTYQLWVQNFSPEKEALLRRPVELDGYRIQPPWVHLDSRQEDRARLTIRIHEGRNRQIRRMSQLAGLTVTRLRRIQEGSIILGDLPLGAWRYLTAAEVRQLSEEAGGFFREDL